MPSILHLLLVSFGLPGLALADCPSLPAEPPPVSSTTMVRAAPASVYETEGGRAAAALGIGHLHVPEDSPGAGDTWLQRIRLPLWRQPQAAAFQGWLMQGRVLAADGTPSALTGAGLVETGYEQDSLIVWESRPEGWLRLRLAPDRDAWTHRCHLMQGGAALHFERWEEFLRRHGGWLHFRAQAPQPLRAAPHGRAAAVARIGEDHKLEWLERRGDWLRVRLQQPDTSCRDPEAKSSTREGWVQWRDAQRGPLLWIHTRGC